MTLLPTVLLFLFQQMYVHSNQETYLYHATNYCTQHSGLECNSMTVYLIFLQIYVQCNLLKNITNSLPMFLIGNNDTESIRFVNGQSNQYR